MGPDDKTTEIEINQARRSTDARRSNIVHVNFTGRTRKPSTPAWLPGRGGHPASVSVGKFRTRTVDRISPWMIRVIALLAILLLSLLVI